MVGSLNRLLTAIGLWLVVLGSAMACAQSAAQPPDSRPNQSVQQRRATSATAPKSNATTQRYHHDMGAGLPANTREFIPPVFPRVAGTKIVPNRTSTGEDLRRETEFAAILSRFDPKPRIRADHFQWLGTNQAFVNLGGRIVGWGGLIVSSDFAPGRGHIYKVRMFPRIVPEVRSPILDHVEETYLYNGTGFILLDSDALIEKPHLRKFPALD